MQVTMVLTEREGAALLAEIGDAGTELAEMGEAGAELAGTELGGGTALVELTEYTGDEVAYVGEAGVVDSGTVDEIGEATADEVGVVYELADTGAMLTVDVTG